MPELWSLQGHRHIKDLASISNISKLKHWLRHTRQIVPHHLVIIWRSYHISIIIQPPHTLAYEVISILSSSAGPSTITSLPPKGQCTAFSQCKINPIQHFLPPPPHFTLSLPQMQIVPSAHIIYFPNISHLFLRTSLLVQHGPRKQVKRH